MNVVTFGDYILLKCELYNFVMDGSPETPTGEVFHYVVDTKDGQNYTMLLEQSDSESKSIATDLNHELNTLRDDGWRGTIYFYDTVDENIMRFILTNVYVKLHALHLDWTYQVGRINNGLAMYYMR